eukprot:10776938-Alexandrium_andersonii.AAC.1
MSPFGPVGTGPRPIHNSGLDPIFVGQRLTYTDTRIDRCCKRLQQFAAVSAADCCVPPPP